MSLTSKVVGTKRASAALEVTGMSQSDAERLLATVWWILEAFAVTSPILEVRSAHDVIDITLTFGSAADCALVENSLWTRDGLLVAMGTGTIDPLVSVDTESIGRIH